MFVKYNNIMHPERKPDMRPIFLMLFLITMMQAGFARRNDGKPASVHSRSLDISRSRNLLLDKFLEHKVTLGIAFSTRRLQRSL